MPPKDYVKRGRAPAKNVTKDVPKPQLPWVKIVIAVIALAGFGYFLWMLSNTPTPPEQQKSTDQETAIIESDPIPAMPVEPYDYPNELVNTEVEIDEKQQEKSTRPYLMQCGSFQEETQAQALRAKIALQGYEAQVRASDGKNGRWYRVILGPFDYKRDAETVRHVLQRDRIRGCEIWFWNL